MSAVILHRLWDRDLGLSSCRRHQTQRMTGPIPSLVQGHGYVRSREALEKGFSQLGGSDIVNWDGAGAVAARVSALLGVECVTQPVTQQIER